MNLRHSVTFPGYRMSQTRLRTCKQLTLLFTIYVWSTDDNDSETHTEKPREQTYERDREREIERKSKRAKERPEEQESERDKQRTCNIITARGPECTPRETVSK